VSNHPSVRPLMAEWYEVFDHVAVLRTMRARVGRLATLAVFGTAPLVVLVPAVFYLVPGAAVAAAVALVGMTLAALYVARELGALRGVVWCVELSARRLAGYDYRRRRVSLRWPAVERVEIDAAGLVIAGRDERGESHRLRIPASFPDFSRLSHRLVEYAEAYGRPLYVDGRPWASVDVYRLYPFLRATRGVAPAR